ncbi:uncharacterized protein F5147DRAFT_396792 [Suillus discolor]|uniref:Uncharacterized protein n=1 Tax=Suillus discolor TaxID=1912936 RepID=A0A9P7EYE5_9AGAM|nr:uncharacterized protein F5147DRAFT_396792 [Suillus discolor]KAG2095922.1 hypothetical protein F5147DRAFT_396792 [Suillus discolor]
MASLAAFFPLPAFVSALLLPCLITSNPLSAWCSLAVPCKVSHRFTLSHVMVGPGTFDINNFRDGQNLCADLSCNTSTVT